MKKETVIVKIEVPRDAFTTVAAPVEWISQRTCERETGVGARSYLEDVGSALYPAEVIKRGKLRITRLRDYVEHIRAVSQARCASETTGDGADAVLAELGLVVKRGAPPSTTGAIVTMAPKKKGRWQ